VFAGLLLVGGTLGDRFGRRRALFAGLGIFGAGSALAALSGSAEELIAARALMGMGSAAIMPATLSILTSIFPAEERPRAIAAWAAVSGLGIALGPISGGLLLEEFGWTSAFLVNLPIVVVALRPPTVDGATRSSSARSPAARRSSGRSSRGSGAYRIRCSTSGSSATCASAPRACR
jgi:MFS family permease